MTRRILTIAGLLAFTIGASAEILSPEQAFKRAVSSGPLKVSAKSTFASKPVYTVNTVAEQPAVYVFPSKDGAGYLMLSADDVALPVLGYSDEGSFDVDNMPPQLKWWLSEYSNEIDYARSKGVEPSKSAPLADGRERILPMVKTKWSQDAPYYNDCPVSGGRHCYTGCVATAMAQTMNYFQYPEVGQGRKRYKCQGIGTLEMDFSAQKFDWGNMIDAYDPGEYTTEEADAVAYLMKACGYSVEMYYTTSASGAVSADIVGALKDNFKYDGNIRYEQRLVYSASEWNNMIYENLKNVGPVIYDGNSAEGGHSFICDGYDGNGYFHFNWGWGGSADGYFLLNALNPTTQGIGGYEGGYNSSQDAVLGIQKPTGEPVIPQEMRLLQYGALHAQLTGDQISLTFVNWKPAGLGVYSSEKVRCNVAGVFEPIDGTPGETIVQEVSNLSLVTLSPGAYYATSSGFSPKIPVPASLKDGKYKMTFSSREAKNDDAKWIPVMAPYGYPNYIYVEKKDNVVTVTNVAIPVLSIESIELLSECYYGYPIKIKLKLHNPSEFELTNAISPLLLSDGKQAFVGDSKMFTLAAGETREEEWVVNLTKQQGATIPSAGASVEYTFSAYDPSIDIEYGTFGDVTMKRLRASNNIRSRGLSILNAQGEDTEQGYVYSINDCENIEVAQKVEVVSGYFAYPVIARIYKENVNRPGYLSFVMEQSLGDVNFIASGDITTIESAIEFPEAERGVIYYMRTYYVVDNTPKQLAQVQFTLSSTAVDAIESDDDLTFFYDRASKTVEITSMDGVKAIQAYNVNGVLLNERTFNSETSVKMDMSSLGKGMVMIVVKDGNGHIKTFKTAL